MKTSAKLTTTALAILLLAQSAAAQRQKAAAADYFPLREGDSWTYKSMSGGDAEYTVKVLDSEKQADGTTRFRVEKFAGLKIHSWFSKADGWVLMHGETYPEHEGLEARYAQPRRYLKNPPVARAKWEWKGEGVTKGALQESCQVVGLEVVEVPAGRFRAMKVGCQVSDDSAQVTKTFWYANGVGLVKTTSEAGQIKYGWELADYSFKNKGRSR